MKITLKQLEVFCLVAKHGSLSMAAEKIFLSQPAASMALKQLEDTLGASLFDRKGKKLILNAFGQQQLHAASDIVERTYDLTASTQESAIQGTIHIGASHTIGNYLLPELIAQFLKTYPEVHIDLTIANTKQLEQDLLKLRYDMIIVEGELKTHQEMNVELWQHDSLHIVCNHKHPLAKKVSVSIKDLEAYPWVCREEGSGTHQLLQNVLFTSFEPNIQIRVNSFAAMTALVMHSDYLGCVPQSSLLAHCHKKIKVLKNKHISVNRELSMATHKSKYQSKAVDAFISFLMK